MQVTLVALPLSTNTLTLDTEARQTCQAQVVQCKYLPEQHIGSLSLGFQGSLINNFYTSIRYVRTVDKHKAHYRHTEAKWLLRILVSMFLLFLTKLLSLEEALDGKEVSETNWWKRQLQNSRKAWSKWQSYNLSSSETKENIKKLNKNLLTIFIFFFLRNCSAS